MAPLKLKVLRGTKLLKGLRRPGRRELKLLPHVLTVASLAAGVVSILFTMNGEVALAALAILASFVLDGFDGRVARWLGAEGDFGKQMDSLADVVAFGLAPAILMYEVNLKDHGPWGWAVTAVFPICGALRLARFNILKVSGYFVGLPITAAGTLLALFVLYGRRLEHWAFSLATLGIAYLMVSTIRYPDFKKGGPEKLRWLPILLPTAVTIAVLRADPRTVIFLPLLLYAASGVYLQGVRVWDRSIGARLRELSLRRS